MDIPQGNSREEVRMRDKIIKDFYAGWIAENPDKKMWNEESETFLEDVYNAIGQYQDDSRSSEIDW